MEETAVKSPEATRAALPPVPFDQQRAPYVALASVGVLCVLGVVMIYSASALPGTLKGGAGEYHYLKKQGFFLLLGLGAMAIAYRTPRAWLGKGAYALLAVTLVGLVAVLVPGVGHEVNGASRWLRHGSFGIQVSDIAKLALILVLAHHLGASRDRARSLKRGALPVMAVTGLLAGLVVVEPDFGTALFIVGLGAVLAVAGGVRWLHLAPPVVFGLAGMAMVVWQKFDHVRDRVAVFLDPAADPLGKGHQVRQSLIALGSGGVTGTGLGAGRQKLFFLPEDFTDFILALIGEEMGLIGTLVVVACFFAFFLAALSIARRARTAAGALTALGVGVLISLQGFINIAVVTASVPTKGISLPFVSYGGSSLVIMCAAVGILIRIARDSAPEKAVSTPVPDLAPDPVPA